MESLISDLRQQYAASTASVAVSQAMLLHALNQRTRQVASRVSANQIQSSPDNLLNLECDAQPRPGANNNQYAPLDLSVKRQANGQRSRSQSNKLPKQHQQQQTLNLFHGAGTKTRNHKRSDSSGSSHHHHHQHHQNQSKLITSSTSPTSSGSTTSSATSSEPACCLRDPNNNHIDVPALAQELISSTNGRRRQRNRRHQQAESKRHKGAAKSHLCNFCGRSFSRSDMLTRHSRLHSGLKPYQCGKCYQVFSRSDHLSTHERTHTGEKPYQCQYCDYSACRRDMITRHMRTHSTSQDGELETRANSRRRRRRKTGDRVVKDSTGDRIEGEEDDVSTSFEISVT